MLRYVVIVKHLVQRVDGFEGVTIVERIVMDLIAQVLLLLLTDMGKHQVLLRTVFYHLVGHCAF